MHNFGFALSGAWQVLIVALIVGAGLPALFAVGMRALAYSGGDDSRTATASQRFVGKAVSYVAFGIIIAVVLLGITYIVASGFGKTISFEHIYPTLVNEG